MLVFFLSLEAVLRMELRAFLGLLKKLLEKYRVILVVTDIVSVFNGESCGDAVFLVAS